MQQDNLPGKQAVERIKKALKELSYNDTEIAAILLQTEIAVQTEVGNELLETLPQDKREQVKQMFEQKKNLKEIAPYFSHIPISEMNQKLEEKLNKMADSLEASVKKADQIDAEIDAQTANLPQNPAQENT